MVSVTGYLVTTAVGEHWDFWAAVAGYSNWLDCKPCRNNRAARMTWHVMVADGQEQFLAVAQQMPGVTVEEIQGVWNERLVLHVGEPGTGWGKPQ